MPKSSDYNEIAKIGCLKMNKKCLSALKTLRLKPAKLHGS